MITVSEKTAEEIVRTVHYIGVKVAGERGHRAANRLTQAAGLGHVEFPEIDQTEPRTTD